jgi:hypothetical protein
MKIGPTLISFGLLTALYLGALIYDLRQQACNIDALLEDHDSAGLNPAGASSHFI